MQLKTVSVALGMDTGCTGLPNLACQTIVEVDVGQPIRVMLHQIGGTGLESDKATVGAHSGEKVVAICLADAETRGGLLGHSGMVVAYKDVGKATGVSENQVGGNRSVHHKSAAGADRGRDTQSKPTGTAAVHTETDGHTDLEVVDKDVP